MAAARGAKKLSGAARLEACMSDRTPQSLWERLRRAFEGWMGPDAEVDEASVLFHLVFVAPLFLAFVLLVRR